MKKDDCELFYDTINEFEQMSLDVELEIMDLDDVIFNHLTVSRRYSVEELLDIPYEN